MTRHARWLRDFTVPVTGIEDDESGTGHPASGEVTFLKDDVVMIHATEETPPRFVITGVGVFAAVEGKDFEFVEPKDMI